MFGFHWYGLIIGLGVLASCSASAWLARRRGLDPNLIWNGLWRVLVPALIGARLYHVADRWNDIYRFDPISSLYIWNGGLGIFGGLIGGFLGLLLWFRSFGGLQSRRRRDERRIGTFKELLDLVFFGLLLGQTIGRLGNFVNQEVYGPPTTLPWGIYINPENRLSQYANYSIFHPLFAYEALWNLLGFALMIISEKFNRLSQIRRSFAGFYLTWYGLGRFALDFLRPPEFSWTISAFNLGQLFSAGLFFAGAIILCRGRESNSHVREDTRS